MYDEVRFKERRQAIKNNLRNFASTQCASAEELLTQRDDLMNAAMDGILMLYDAELQDIFDDRMKVNEQLNKYMGTYGPLQ